MLKKTALQLFTTCLLMFAFAAYSYGSAELRGLPEVPSGTMDDVRAADVLNFTTGDYARMTGKKMTLKNKAALIILKTKLRKEVKKNPDLLLSDFYKDNKKMATGWVVLLVILSVVLLAFLIFAIAYGSKVK